MNQHLWLTSLRVQGSRSFRGAYSCISRILSFPHYCVSPSKGQLEGKRMWGQLSKI